MQNAIVQHAQLSRIVAASLRSGLPEVIARSHASFAMQEVMIDPTIAADGHTYERHAMHEWLTEHSTSPVTGALLLHAKLLPNIIIGNAIAHHQQLLQHR